MKKIASLIIAVVATLSLTSCKKEEHVDVVAKMKGDPVSSYDIEANKSTNDLSWISSIEDTLEFCIYDSLARTTFLDVSSINSIFGVFESIRFMYSCNLDFS